MAPIVSYKLRTESSLVVWVFVLLFVCFCKCQANLLYWDTMHMTIPGLIPFTTQGRWVLSQSLQNVPIWTETLNSYTRTLSLSCPGSPASALLLPSLCLRVLGPSHGCTAKQRLCFYICLFHFPACLQVHPCRGMCQNFVSFDDWIKTHTQIILIY